MTTTNDIAMEYERRKQTLAVKGFRVLEYVCGDLLIVEMFVRDERTGSIMVRKQEGVGFQGRSKFLIECRKLMALERLSNVVPQMCQVRKMCAGEVVEPD